MFKLQKKPLPPETMQCLAFATFPFSMFTTIKVTILHLCVFPWNNTTEEDHAHGLLVLHGFSHTIHPTVSTALTLLLSVKQIVPFFGNCDEIWMKPAQTIRECDLGTLHIVFFFHASTDTCVRLTYGTEEIRGQCDDELRPMKATNIIRRCEVVVVSVYV